MNRATKRVLIISYYWPPCGGIGVLRCLKFAKYLSQLGWTPVIYTAENAHYPTLDATNEKDIPANAEILKGKIWEPYHIYKFITGQKQDANVNNVFYTKEKKIGWTHNLSVWIRSNFFIPDARAKWMKPSVTYLLEYLKDHPVDAILSDGPPHSNTRIATILRKETGIPWIADFQDPWSQVDYFQELKLTSWGLKKHLRLEQEAFQYADKTTIVSPTWKGELEELGAKNVSVVYWGYDPDDYQDLPQKVDEKFTITHLGILGYDRNPATFLKVLKHLCGTVPSFKEKLELKLVGQVDYSIKQVIEELQLEEVVNYVGQVKRKEALHIMATSNLLLLPLNQQPNAKGRIPGKIFEYLAVRRPMIGLGPKQSDVRHIIETTKAGKYSEYDDKHRLEKILRSYFQLYKEGQLKNKLDSNIEAFSVKKQTEHIHQLLCEITKTPQELGAF